MRELIEKYVGKIGTIFVGGLSVKVEVKDVKQAWGRDRFLVSPVEGSGSVWVEAVAI